MAEYIYDQSWEQERARLAGLEAALDPGTIRLLKQLGVEPGWQCLEVGGGGGSITSWLCDRVGPTGRVVATDLDPRFLEVLEHDNLEVRRHDITQDALEPNAFDLVHSRDLLEHLPAADAALDRMLGALRPGGVLLVEDVDIEMTLEGLSGAHGHPARLAELAERWWRAGVPFMRAAGVDTRCGRRLAGKLLDRGLAEVGADLRARLVRGGAPEISVFRLSLQHFRPRLLEQGELSAAEIDELIAAFGDPRTAFMVPPHVAAWGRKPV